MDLSRSVHDPEILKGRVYLNAPKGPAIFIKCFAVFPKTLFRNLHDGAAAQTGAGASNQHFRKAISVPRPDILKEKAKWKRVHTRKKQSKKSG